MTAYILNLLANENERELKDVVSNLKPGTPVCELAFLAWQLNTKRVLELTYGEF
ncbi:MAG: hypothetical protein K6G18_16940 [Treponema sp.]|nr:hypothetical protein [Treponema sp.]